MDFALESRLKPGTFRPVPSKRQQKTVGKKDDGKKSKESQKAQKATSRSSQAGLQFPVGRVHRHLRIGRYAKRIGADAPVYLAAVLEYLTAEILELSGNASRDNKKKRIIPRHIRLAIKNDEELTKLLGTVNISNGGVQPNIHAVLLPKNKAGGKSKKAP